nr:MAG TPA: hypothetical protein [Caudoviricetes sp.]DAS96167.1 MAG TPA: hypothetical protein [Caudoviricetes sp.]
MRFQPSKPRPTLLHTHGTFLKKAKVFRCVKIGQTY